MFNYYEKSMQVLENLLAHKKDLTEEEWNGFKDGKALFGSESLKWIYAQTEDWKLFLQKVKEEMKGKPKE